MQEFELINKFFLKLASKKKASLNLNDDVFFDKNKGLVISVDSYNEGVHFVDFKQPHQVIKKVIRSSISDLICKGVRPKYYFISGAGNKKHFSKKNLINISESLSEEQKKYGILLCGGDTTYSTKLNFSITVLGFSNKIIYRNKAKLNDDIYVTGNLGDSFIGLEILKKRIKVSKKDQKYFVSRFYRPDVQIKLTEKLLRFSNSSIDISDGLVSDLEKLINRQKLKYQLFVNDIPISQTLSNLIKKRKISKTKVISKGDDYQILFTALTKKSNMIKKISNKLGIKITKIGKILSHNKKSLIVDEKGNDLRPKYKGYIHQF